MKAKSLAPLRRFLSAALIVTLSGMTVLSSAVTADAAAAAGYNNFTRRVNYDKGQFQDVSSQDWFAQSVIKVYELGLMSGRSAAAFDPMGNVTVSEAISMAARTHNIYEGGQGALPKAPDFSPQIQPVPHVQPPVRPDTAPQGQTAPPAGNPFAGISDASAYVPETGLETGPEKGPQTEPGNGGKTQPEGPDQGSQASLGSEPAANPQTDPENGEKTQPETTKPVSPQEQEAVPLAQNTAGRWYNDAVHYAVNHKIIKQTDFGGLIPQNLEKPATRAQLAYIFYGACPAESLAPINDVPALPDVTEYTPNSQLILTLYRAGIMSGNDSYGTFRPESYITRSEAASILTRIAVPKERRSFKLQGFTFPIPYQKLTRFSEQKETFALTADENWKEVDSYKNSASRLTLLLSESKDKASKNDSSKKGQTAKNNKEESGGAFIGEILSFVSSKKDADAPLQVFHGLTAESLAKAIRGKELSKPALVSLPGTESFGYVSVLTSGTEENALYWVLTGGDSDGFITLIGRASKDSSPETQGKIISTMKTLTLLMPISRGEEPISPR